MKRKKKLTNKAIRQKQHKIDARIFDFIAGLVPEEFRECYPNYSYRDFLERSPDPETCADIEWIGKMRDLIAEIIREKLRLPDAAIPMFDDCFYPLTETDKEFLRSF